MPHFVVMFAFWQKGRVSDVLEERGLEGALQCRRSWDGVGAFIDGALEGMLDSFFWEKLKT